MRKIILFLLIIFIFLVSGCSKQIKSLEIEEIKNGFPVEPPENLIDIRDEDQQTVYSVNNVLNKSSLFLNKSVCVDGIIREHNNALYIIDEKERKWLLDRLEGKRIKLSKKEIVVDSKYLICGEFSKDEEYQISISTFTLGGSNRETQITEEISKLCYYLISGVSISGDAPMGFAALPLKKPHPCNNDEECISLGPSYKNWSIEEVKCKLDNRKACITDEDCVLGGTCCYIKQCFNKDYWTDYYDYTCKKLNCEMQKDPVYPYSGCTCVNNYCEEIIESKE